MDPFETLDPFNQYNLILAILDKYHNNLPFLKYVLSLIQKELNKLV